MQVPVTPLQRCDAASAGNVVAGSVAQDAAQDIVMSRGADGCRTSPCEKEDDDERAKRHRTEKTELEMEVSNEAKIKDSRRVLDLRRDGWEQENINHRDAAMFCTCELRRSVILTCCTKRSQHGIYAGHKGREGLDTCANSSATSQMIQ